MSNSGNPPVLRRKRRRPLRIALNSAVVLLVLWLAACQTVTAVLYSQNFDLRFEGFGAFAVSDFPNLASQSESFPSDKGQLLHGDFIWDAGQREQKAKAVVNHGFGGGKLDMDVAAQVIDFYDGVLKQ